MFCSSLGFHTVWPSWNSIVSSFWACIFLSLGWDVSLPEFWKQNLRKMPTCEVYLGNDPREQKWKTRGTKQERMKSIEWSEWYPVGNYFELLVPRTFWKLHDMSSVRAVHSGTKGRRKNVFINSGPYQPGMVVLLHAFGSGSHRCRPEMSEKPWSGNERCIWKPETKWPQVALRGRSSKPAQRCSP